MEKTEKDSESFEDALFRVLTETKNSGVKPTHFLLFNLTFAEDKTSFPARKEGDQSISRYEIGCLFYNHLHAKTSEVRFSEGDTISLTWYSPASKPGFFYYCVTRFADTYIRYLTKIAIKRIYDNLLSTYLIQPTDVEVGFTVQKILDFGTASRFSPQDRLGGKSQQDSLGGESSV